MASRRWIDLAMLTPGVSQDNIRGFFYRGNVNIGAGTREYSNGFVVDGVNNTWAQMGEPRQNFAMDSIREFKVSTSTYKAEYGLATGGMLSVVTKSGTNQLHGSAFMFFRDKSLTAKTNLRDRAARLPPVSVRRHGRRPDRQEQDALLRRLRGHRREPVLHGERGRSVAAVRRHLQERPESLDVHGEGRSPVVAVAEPVLPRGAGGRVPPDHHDRRACAPDQQLRLRGAARLVRPRPHVGGQFAADQRRPLAVRVRQVRGGAALQPRIVGAGRLRPGPARPLHGGLQLPVARAGRLRQQPDGTREALPGEERHVCTPGATTR